jgi:CheY-like chemotaxis protein
VGAANHPVQQDKSPLCALLVDDHADTCEVVSRLLTMDGHRVTCAYTLAQARASIDDCQFDLLICDVELPDGNGLELLAYAREQYPVQGISLSGYGGDVPERAAAAGFCAHLSKPFSVAILREAIENATAQQAPTARALSVLELGDGVSDCDKSRRIERAIAAQ